MKTIFYNSLSGRDKLKLTGRPGIDTKKALDTVRPILEEIKKNGISALLKYSRLFDNLEGEKIQLDRSLIENSEYQIDDNLRKAIITAADNITTFHEKQIPQNYSLETMPGVVCSKEYRPIQDVGLYIPGGSAVLPSTMLMLGIPARLAGCKRIIACSPAKGGRINQAVLFAAKLAGVKEFYTVGGAQAIALMAYGTESIDPVDKIFGPGNQFVTAAKSLVSIDTDGCAVDMPAGPSEVLVIADSEANPLFVAADILSQAEHGPDSQSILVTDSDTFAHSVLKELEVQLSELERKEIAQQALNNSFVLVTGSIPEAIEFSNKYAPEHLILNVAKPENYVGDIINAGSVFLGAYSPESAGDYASGTNHSLPTYGYAKSYSGLGVIDFMKGITFQKLNREGLQLISETVITLAETEKLQGHAKALKVRL